MRKILKPGRRYFIINIDEPYAEDIYKVLKKGQMKKGEWPEGNISFEEWKKQTWPEENHSSKEDVNTFRESRKNVERPKNGAPVEVKKRGSAGIKGRERV